MTDTMIYLNGTCAYRREHDIVKRCKKSQVATLVENRKSFVAIILKNAVKRYDKIFQSAGFYMAEVNDYNSDEYIIKYNHMSQI